MKIFMVVFNTLKTDARVQRSIEYLTNDFDVTLISFGKSHSFKSPRFNHIELEKNQIIFL